MPCSLVQLARVVVVRDILIDVICVMLVVLITHVDVVAVFVQFWGTESMSSVSMRAQVIGHGVKVGVGVHGEEMVKCRER